MGRRAGTCTRLGRPNSEHWCCAPPTAHSSPCPSAHRALPSLLWVQTHRPGCQGKRLVFEVYAQHKQLVPQGRAKHCWQAAC
eukprot:1159227-Pelagomonas_calceolata.AAC.8